MNRLLQIARYFFSFHFCPTLKALFKFDPRISDFLFLFPETLSLHTPLTFQKSELGKTKKKRVGSGKYETQGRAFASA